MKLSSLIKKHKVLTIITSVLLAASIAGASVGGYFLVRHSLRRSKGIIPSDEDLANAVKYDRVVIFGVDGAGRFFEDTDTPNFNMIFGSGAINYRAFTQFESDSAPNWTSMLHGVRYRKHHVHNEDSGVNKFTNEKYPSIFKIYNEVHPEAKHLSIANWGNIAYGIIEDLDYVTKITTGNDDLIMDKFYENYLTLDPVITFLCFDDVDAAGHSTGRSEKYYNEIKEADRKIGEIYNFLKDNQKLEKTLFLCTADHGHKKSGGHGIELPSVYQTMIAVNGDLGNIKTGKMGRAVTQDVASIVLYGLGIKQPKIFDAKVPYNTFTTLKK